MSVLLRGLKELRRYPSAIAGLFVVTAFFAVAIYAIIAIPYSEALRLWRGGPGVWDEVPRAVPPVWTDWFTSNRLARTIVVSNEAGGHVTVEPLDGGLEWVEIVLPVDYQYDGFPTEMNLFLQATFDGGRRPVSIHWTNPLGVTTPISERYRMRQQSTVYITQEPIRDLMPGRTMPHVGLVLDPDTASGKVEDRVTLKGRHELVIAGEFPEGANLVAKLVVYGQVHGVSGSDHRRRDLSVALLWGAPLALLFGIVGAVGANLSTFVLSGIGTWYGGWLDSLFQRITEANMILPVLPILIMVGHFYSRSLWLMLGLIIGLSVFSAAMITYRAMFLQAKESPYIEAAQAYGASNMRIVFRYLLPRLAPTLLPQFVGVIPAFVFLEASLAVLGLGDPVLPTWGKVLNDAWSNHALWTGAYYWPIQPALLLMFTGFGFALVGYSLDRVFNPRLRGM